MSELDEFWVHRLSVQTYIGTFGSGAESLADPIVIDGMLEGVRHLVRDGNGNQVISESTFYADASWRAQLKTRSRVTLVARKDSAGAWQPVTDAEPTQVITVAVNESGDLDLPDHIVVALQ